jgi:hypothetical protein
MFPIVGLFEETSGRKERKRERQRVKNTEIHYICEGRRHKEGH